MTELDKVRCGGRNYLRPGDPCRIRAGGADHRSFPARVRRILDTPAGVEVEVAIARPHRKAGTIRTVRLDRVRRVQKGADL